jgi:peptidoglycan/LPS O-acetylase OafA/YrhL
MGESGRASLRAEAVGIRRDEAGDRTVERNRSAVLDAVRALAALMVLVAHASFIANGGRPGPVGTALRQMFGAGVLIFFSLSGYLIAGPFLRALVEGERLPTISTYLVRRAARIYPAYWVAFAAVLILLWPAGGVRPYQWPVHVLLLQSSWPHPGEPTSIYFVAWTLGVEAAFYVFVPLAALVLRALHPGPWRAGRLAWLVVAAGLASAGWAYVAAARIAPDTSTPALFAQIGLQIYLYAFCPGMVIALAAIAAEQGHPWRLIERLMAKPVLTLAAVAALWGLAYAAERSGTRWVQINYQVPFVLASGLLLGTLVVARSWIRPIVRVLAPFGLISYGIYLWHDTIVQLIWQHSSIGLRGGGGAWLGDCLLVAAITLPLAAVSWFVIERPSMRAAAAWARKKNARIAWARPTAGELPETELTTSSAGTR